MACPKTNRISGGTVARRSFFSLWSPLTSAPATFAVIPACSLGHGLSDARQSGPIRQNQFDYLVPARAPIDNRIFSLCMEITAFDPRKHSVSNVFSAQLRGGHV